MRILAIRRDTAFSPSSTARDERIISAVISGLRAQGVTVDAVAERSLYDELWPLRPEGFNGIISMARDPRSLAQLARLEALRLPIVNAPSRLLSATRAHLCRLFEENGVAQPAYAVLDTAAADALTAEELTKACSFPLWLKRSEGCAQRGDDVVFITDLSALRSALKAMHARGIREAVAMTHVEGDLIKWYGVAATTEEGESFFHYDYATATGAFSKFGNEAHNGRPRQIVFDPGALRRLASRAASAAGFAVYGGDAVIRPDGQVVLIDFNDFPSFSPCYVEASRAIVDYLISTTHHVYHQASCCGHL